MEDVYEFWLPEYIYEREGKVLSEPYQQVTESLKNKLYVSCIANQLYLFYIAVFSDIQVKFAEQQILHQRVTKSYSPPDDTCWNKQWYLVGIIYEQ